MIDTGRRERITQDDSHVIFFQLKRNVYSSPQFPQSKSSISTKKQIVYWRIQLTSTLLLLLSEHCMNDCIIAFSRCNVCTSSRRLISFGWLTYHVEQGWFCSRRFRLKETSSMSAKVQKQYIRIVRMEGEERSYVSKRNIRC